MFRNEDKTALSSHSWNENLIGLYFKDCWNNMEEDEKEEFGK